MTRLRSAARRRFRTTILQCECLEERRVLAAPIAAPDGIPLGAQFSVPLQNATAFGSQSGFSVAAAIDADATTGWADGILGGTPSNTAVFETVTNFGGDSTMLNISMLMGGFPNCVLGNFRISVTNEDRDLFANGAINNGNLGDPAIWTPIHFFSARSDNAGATLQVNADRTILHTGSVAPFENYTLRGYTSMAGISGFRIEAIEHPSLPDTPPGLGGPGMCANGNFVLYTFDVTAQPNAVPLQNATSTGVQGNGASFSTAALIDGIFDPGGDSTASWAGDLGGVTPSNTAVFETQGNLNPTGADTLLTFSIPSGYFGNHKVGKVRISATTDDRALFADGLSTLGDVDANWTQLTPLQATSSGPLTYTINSDNSVIANGAAVAGLETLTIRSLTNLANITGFRLEVLEDPLLPAGGPGLAVNGNYVIYEFGVTAQRALVASEEGTTTLNVLANDSDADPGDIIRIQSVNTAGVLGAISNNLTHLSYTAPLSFQPLRAGEGRVENFSYTIHDLAGNTSTATVVLVVQGVNDPPVAANDVQSPPLQLQNATATHQQAGFGVASAINGNATEAGGWALSALQNQNQTAVFQTAAPLAAGPLSFDLIFNSVGNAAHKAQNFRLSVTNSPNPTVTSGATWTQLTPEQFSTSRPGSDIVLDPDNPGSDRLMITGDVAVPDTYTVLATNLLAGVTGIRLELFTGANGFVGFNTGGGNANGNIVLTEFRVTSAFVTNEDTILSGGGLLANDTDIDVPTTLVVSPAGARTGTLGATVIVNANGTFTYDPSTGAALQALIAGQTATDFFTYSASDGAATSNLATVSITVTGVNDAPTANANGPYTISERQDLQLNAIIADADAGANLTIEWDLDGDGIFNNVHATGAAPTVAWQTLTTLSTNPITDQLVNRPISVRVTDGIAAPVTSNTTLTVTNAAPAVTIVADAVAVVGQPVDFTINIADAPADVTAKFIVQIDWDGPGPQPPAPPILNVGASLLVTHIFDSLGTFNVTVTARDKDLATTTPAASHTIAISNFIEDGGVLTIGGSGSSDRITVQPASGGGVKVVVNGKSIGTFGNFFEGLIFGGGGNDTITVTPSLQIAFTLDGGDGNDYLAGGALADTILGGAGNDRIFGGGGADFIFGGDGNDTIAGGAGADTIDGEGGNDTAKGEADNDILLGGDGNDRLFGDGGSDLVRGGEGIDQVDGGAGANVLSGDASSDKLYGRAGNDVLVGGDSFDFIYGGAGDDLIIGGLVIDDSDDGLLLLLSDWLDASGSTIEKAEALLSSMTAATDEDGAGDTLYGEAGADWYLMFLNDKVYTTDKKLPNVLSNLTL